MYDLPRPAKAIKTASAPLWSLCFVRPLSVPSPAPLLPPLPRPGAPLYDPLPRLEGLERLASCSGSSPCINLSTLHLRPYFRIKILDLLTLKIEAENTRKSAGTNHPSRFREHRPLSGAGKQAQARIQGFALDKIASSFEIKKLKSRAMLEVSTWS